MAAVYKTDRDLAALIRSEIGDRITQRQWAAKAGISPAYLSDFLSGKRGAGPTLLKALGFQPTPYYRRGVISS